MPGSRIVTAAFSLLACAAYANDFCSGPQNADAAPLQRMPMLNGTCHWYQEYSAAFGDDYAGSCGGWALSFGPLGGFEYPAEAVILSTDWTAPKPTSAAACANAYTAVITWGYRCDNADCSTGAWENLKPPAVRQGSWNAQTNACHLGVTVAQPDHSYKTVSIDAQAYLESPQGPVYQPLVSRIYNRIRGNGKCLEADKRKIRIQRQRPRQPKYRVDKSD